MKKSTFKNVVLAAIFFAAGITFTIHKDSLFQRKDPSKLEQTGDFDHALDGFIEKALKNADIKEIADFSSDSPFQKAHSTNNLKKMKEWLIHTDMQPNKKFLEAVEGIHRTYKKVQSEHFVTGGSNSCMQEVYNNMYTSMFKSTNKNGSTLPESIGFITFRSLRAYTYELHLIDTQSGKITHTKLYPENSVCFPATADTYILSVKGSVSFPNGQIWESHRRIIPIENVKKQCVKQYSLKTKIKR